MDGEVVIGTTLDTKQFDKQIQELERQIAEDEQQLQITGKAKLSAEDTKKVQIEVEKLNNKLIDLKKKKQKANEVPLDSKSSGLADSLNKADNSMSSILKKASRWVLAIFSIRSAYAGLSKASGIIAQYDSQYASNLEYIQYALSMVLKPVLETIVRLIYQALNWVNYLANAWFGINLFANASAKSFANAKNSLSSSAKSAKEIKKSLASANFDELNTLQDTTQADSGSAVSGGVATPTFDLSKMNTEPPKWIEAIKNFGLWVKQNWLGILAILGGIGAFFLLFKLFGNKSSSPIKSTTTLLTSFGKALETIALLGGVAVVLKSIKDIIDSFAQSGLSLGETLGLVGGILAEITLSFVAMNLVLKSMDWQSLVGAVVILGGLSLVLVAVANLLDSFAKSGLKVNDVIKLMATIFIPIVALMGAIVLLGPAMTAGLIPFLAVVAGISAILTVMALTLPKILESAGNFITKIAPTLNTTLETIGNLITDIIIALGETLPPILQSLGQLFSSVFNGIQGVVNSAGNAVRGILDGIRYVIQQIGNTISQVAYTVIWFINNLGPAINNFVSNTIYAVTRLVNFVASAVEYLVNRAVDGINGIASVINQLPGVNIGRKSYVYIPRFRPRLATGGIINLPNKGVPIGGAIAGESGREGVLPLTDNQAMAQLGLEIGKHITINLDLTNSVDGRVLNRILKQVNTQSNFAYNS